MEKTLSAFLSHSSLDEPHVKIVQRFLSIFGIEPWVSYDDIHSSDWGELIAKQIKTNDIFLLILSNNSANSEAVQDECYVANKVGKRFIVYDLEPTTIPNVLELPLARKQRIFSYQFPNKSLERLARIIINESGLEWDDYSAKAREAASRIRLEQLESKKEHQLRLNEYKELYWNCRTRNGKHRKDSAITVADRDSLGFTKNKLALTDAELANVKAEFERRQRKAFTKFINDTLTQAAIIHENLASLERKRLECCVSKCEVEYAINKRKRIPKLNLNISLAFEVRDSKADNLPIDVSYIITLLENKGLALELTEAKPLDKKAQPLSQSQSAETTSQALVRQMDPKRSHTDEKKPKNPDNILLQEKNSTSRDASTPQAPNKSHSQTRKREPSSINQKLDLNIAITVSEYADGRHVKTIMAKSLWHDGVNIHIAPWSAENRASQFKSLTTKDPITRIVAGKDQIVIFHSNNKAAMALEIRHRMNAYSNVLAFLESFPLQIEHQTSLNDTINLDAPPSGKVGVNTKETAVSTSSPPLTAQSTIASNGSGTANTTEPCFVFRENVLTVSEVFLGNEINQIICHRIERANGAFTFFGKNKDKGRPDQITTTRKITQISLAANAVKLLQDGQNYLLLSVDPRNGDYEEFVRCFVGSIGVPVTRINSFNDLTTSIDQPNASSPPEALARAAGNQPLGSKSGASNEEAVPTMKKPPRSTTSRPLVGQKSKNGIDESTSSFSCGDGFLLVQNSKTDGRFSVMRIERDGDNYIFFGRYLARGLDEEHSCRVVHIKASGNYLILRQNFDGDYFIGRFDTFKEDGKKLLAFLAASRQELSSTIQWLWPQAHRMGDNRLWDLLVKHQAHQEELINAIRAFDRRKLLDQLFRKSAQSLGLLYGEDLSRDAMVQKLLRDHGLKQLQDFKPILCFSNNKFLAKRSMIIFDRGVSFLSGKNSPQLFMFGIPTNKIAQRIKIKAGENNVRVSISGPVLGSRQPVRASYDYFPGKTHCKALSTSLEKVLTELDDNRSNRTRLAESLGNELWGGMSSQTIQAPVRFCVYGDAGNRRPLQLALDSDVFKLLTLGALPIPDQDDLLFSLSATHSSPQMNFISAILVTMNGATAVSKTGTRVHSRSYTWSDLSTINYIHGSKDSGASSLFQFQRGHLGFDIPWPTLRHKEQTFHEIAAFVMSLKDRMIHLPRS